MAIDDPKTRVRQAPEPETPAEPTMTQVLASMVDLMASMKAGNGSQDANLKQVELMERLLIKTQPENPQGTGISAFFTEADKAQYGTKPTLRCKTIWAGRELYGDVETPEEITLVNRLEHGDYWVTKADGVRITLQVRHKKDSNGNLNEVNVWFPCSKEHKHNHGSMASYCRQALGVAEPTVMEMIAELAKLKAELAAERVGMARA